MVVALLPTSSCFLLGGGSGINKKKKSGDFSNKQMLDVTGNDSTTLERHDKEGFSFSKVGLLGLLGMQEQLA